MRRLTLAIRLSCILLIFASTANAQSSNPVADFTYERPSRAFAAEPNGGCDGMESVTASERRNCEWDRFKFSER